MKVSLADDNNIILNTKPLKHTSAAAFSASSHEGSRRLKSGSGSDPVDIACSDKGLQLEGVESKLRSI